VKLTKIIVQAEVPPVDIAAYDINAYASHGINDPMASNCEITSHINTSLRGLILIGLP
jgi:hypothetical protein